MLPIKKTWFREQSAIKQLLILFLLAVGLVALIAGVLGYKFGYRQGSHNAVLTVTDDKGIALTTTDIQALRLENDILKSEMATLVQERDISLNNLNLLRDELSTLKTSHLQLEQLNEILAQSVAKDGGIPLKVLAAQIAPLPENTFEYRFDVVMLGKDGQGKTLVPKLTLLNATSMADIPLEPSSYNLKGVANIRGRFVMPDGFTPKQMRLVLRVDDQKIEQLYNWRVGKVIDNAPTSLANAPATDNRPISNE
ncbi:MAG: hypothetical protein Q4G13_05705 [Moraxella sp.]|nr:hypothetical protein [Moraxella sp.]